jgi:hypothetical protein
MPMKLTLAVTLECPPAECRVQLLDQAEPVTVHYSARVQARIKIWPGQLVALDTTPAIPEVVYRWHCVKVEQLKEDQILVSSHQGQLVELVKAPGLEATPQVGDWVFATLGNPAEQGEVVDIAVDGRPAHPAWLSSYVLPKVEQFYQRIANNL